MNQRTHMSFDRPKQLNVGACRLDLYRELAGGLGIGEVEVDGHLLRSGARPMFVQVRNPWGVQLCNFVLQAQKSIAGGGLRLEFSADRCEGGMMEWMCHEIRNRVNTADWSRPPQAAEETRLALELRPVTRQLGEFELSGFSYQYHFQSSDIPIYRLFDRGTWEIDGDAAGNTMWIPQGHAPAIHSFTQNGEPYSTGWYHPAARQPNVFQFMPLQTGMQGFTFTSHASGALITWATQVAHIRMLIEKQRGESVIPHFYEHCGDLGHQFNTSPMEVLFCKGELDRVDLLNLHHEVRELVHDLLHDQAGMRRERIRSYGVIEDGHTADIDYYRRSALPKLAGAGCRMVMLVNQFQNDMNVYGIANHCCTVDLKVADAVGEDRLKAFCDEAKDNDMVVEMWGNTSISTTTERFSHRTGDASRIDFLPLEGSVMDAVGRDPDAFIHNPSGAIEADHYTPRFCVLNLRSQAVRDYWIKQWKYAHDHIGLGGIFLDSSFNLSSDKFHWVYNPPANTSGATDDQVTDYPNIHPPKGPDSEILSQYHAHLSLMVEMQKAGYIYSGEDRGVFGLSRAGGSGAQRANSLALWADCFCKFDADRIRESGYDPDEIFFQGLAYRMMWYLYWDPRTDQLAWRHDRHRTEADVPTAWQIDLLKTFNAVEPIMRHRTILPGEAGVIYRNGDAYVLWAFTEMNFRMERAEMIEEMTTGTRLERATPLHAEPRHVYRWQATQQDLPNVEVEILAAIRALEQR
jgi:hypothetical protein